MNTANEIEIKAQHVRDAARRLSAQLLTENRFKDSSLMEELATCKSESLAGLYDVLNKHR